MNRETTERTGCFIMLVLFIAVMLALRAWSNHNNDIGMRKMDVCNEMKLTADQCRKSWNSIKVK